jgi:hypothetical protein
MSKLTANTLFLVRNFLKDCGLHQSSSLLEKEVEQVLGDDIDQVVLEHNVPLLGIVEEWDAQRIAKSHQHLKSKM